MANNARDKDDTHSIAVHLILRRLQRLWWASDTIITSSNIFTATTAERHWSRRRYSTVQFKLATWCLLLLFSMLVSQTGIEMMPETGRPATCCRPASGVCYVLCLSDGRCVLCMWTRPAVKLASWLTQVRSSYDVTVRCEQLTGWSGRLAHCAPGLAHFFWSTLSHVYVTHCQTLHQLSPVKNHLLLKER